MEDKELDAVKTLLILLQGAGVSKYERDGNRTLIEFHRAVPTQVKVLDAPVAVPRDPVDQQLAEKRPDYAMLFPSGFPKHTPPKSE